jgi:hypothetical protein
MDDFGLDDFVYDFISGTCMLFDKNFCVKLYGNV